MRDPRDEGIVERVHDRLLLGALLLRLVAPRRAHPLETAGAVLGDADAQSLEQPRQPGPGRDDADRADDGVRLGHDRARGHGHQVGAGRAGPADRGDERFPRGQPLEGQEHPVRGGRGTARRIDVEHDGRHPAGLAETADELDPVGRPGAVRDRTVQPQDGDVAGREEPAEAGHEGAQGSSVHGHTSLFARAIRGADGRRPGPNRRRVEPIALRRAHLPTSPFLRNGSKVTSATPEAHVNGSLGSGTSRIERRSAT